MTTDATATETLETADAIEPSEAGKSATPETPAQPDSRTPWRDIAQQLGSERDEGASTDDAGADAKPSPTAEESASPAKGEPAPKPEAEAKTAPPAKGGEQPARFEVVGEDGKPVALELPKGAKITFKADGKQVEIATLDDLVKHAQLGIPAQRIRTELGQVQGQLARVITERDDYRGRITTAEERVEKAEDILHQILSDPEKYDEVAKQLGPQLSPEAREAAKLRKEIARRDAERERQTTEQHETGWQQFLEASQQTAVDAITGDTEKYPFLTEGDAGEAVELFVGLYQQTLAELTEQYRPHQSRLGLNDADFATAIAREAQQILTADNLGLVLEKLNARYETRLRPHLAKREADSAAAEARRHNETTTERLARRDESRTLRRTSAPPATGDAGPEAPRRPRNFAEHMAGIRDELDKAAD